MYSCGSISRQQSNMAWVVPLCISYAPLPDLWRDLSKLFSKFVKFEFRAKFSELPAKFPWRTCQNRFATKFTRCVLYIHNEVEIWCEVYLNQEGRRFWWVMSELLKQSRLQCPISLDLSNLFTCRSPRAHTAININFVYFIKSVHQTQCFIFHAAFHKFMHR